MCLSALEGPHTQVHRTGVLPRSSEVQAFNTHTQIDTLTHTLTPNQATQHEGTLPLQPRCERHMCSSNSFSGRGSCSAAPLPHCHCNAAPQARDTWPPLCWATATLPLPCCTTATLPLLCWATATLPLPCCTTATLQPQCCVTVTINISAITLLCPWQGAAALLRHRHTTAFVTRHA